MTAEQEAALRRLLADMEATRGGLYEYWDRANRLLSTPEDYLIRDCVVCQAARFERPALLVGVAVELAPRGAIVQASWDASGADLSLMVGADVHRTAGNYAENGAAHPEALAEALLRAVVGAHLDLLTKRDDT